MVRRNTALAAAFVALTSLSSIAQAATEAFNTKNVSRKVGGQLIYYQLKATSATEVELSFVAKSGEIHIGNVKALTDADETIPFQSAQIIRALPQDAKGRFILKAGAPALRIAFSADSNLSVIGLRAEAFGPGAELEMRAEADALTGEEQAGGTSTPEAPAPTPIPTSAPIPVDPESQCFTELATVNSQLLSCTQDTQSSSYEKTRTDSNLGNLQAALDNANRPLQRCNEQLASINQAYTVAYNQWQGLKQETDSMRARITAFHQLVEESRAVEFECYVKGRHQDFRGRGATRAQALFNTINQCGEGNCGKRAWSVNYDCRPVR